MRPHRDRLRVSLHMLRLCLRHKLLLEQELLCSIPNPNPFVFISFKNKISLSLGHQTLTYNHTVAPHAKPCGHCAYVHPTSRCPLLYCRLCDAYGHSAVVCEKKKPLHQPLAEPSIDTGAVNAPCPVPTTRAAPPDQTLK
jgi:hypothetical protein